jgi:hypothetical protein
MRVCLRKLQSHKSGQLCSRIRQSMGIVSGQPLAIARFEMTRHRALSLDIAAYVNIADGNKQMRAGVVLRRNYGAGPKFEFRNADAIFYEKNLLRAPLKNVQRAIFILTWVPGRSGVAQRLVFQDLNSYVAERLLSGTAHGVRESCGGESSIAILEFDGDRRLVFDGVRNLGLTEIDREVVMAVPVHQRLSLGIDLDIEDAHRFVLEGEMVMGFGGDLDFGSGGLGGDQGCGQKQAMIVHAANCSTRQEVERTNATRRKYYRRKRLSKYSTRESTTLRISDVARGKYTVVFLPR